MKVIKVIHIPYVVTSTVPYYTALITIEVTISLLVMVGLVGVQGFNCQG